MSTLDVFKKLHQAAANGDVSAQAELAKRYETGDGTEIDLIQAFHYASLAAKNNDAESQNSLGVFYATGKGVEQNDALAIQWFEKAAALGFEKASLNLARLYLNGLYKDKDKCISDLRQMTGLHEKDAKSLLKSINKRDN